ncbi:type II secretion system major pseudopilin GspG [Kordiimonas sp. SCSIO 12603]|uniref:type II secretion system major pseudopilin GspG n=1 Tax=Kordiimonas sp. SCSIO 12603 TaxID=2829596 RepID=UPI00210334AD|nr:type II secretion system major pseudopilin GspG [Kordiimonas sp. SCSIO 12603]UTW58738.1 type II secretion system major pseudopilin GspG [Kordiimonas sp. SCSIO 12603]
MDKKSLFRRASEDDGFTLLELLVVLVILTLLIGLAGPVVLRQLGKAKTDTARIEVNRIVTDLEFFRVDVGRFPTQAEGLNALLTAPDGAANWQGPYIDKAVQLVDPWGNDYLYTLSDDGQLPVVRTLGADGADGGAGENLDISSRDGATVDAGDS